MHDSLVGITLNVNSLPRDILRHKSLFSKINFEIEFSLKAGKTFFLRFTYTNRGFQSEMFECTMIEKENRTVIPKENLQEN